MCRPALGVPNAGSLANVRAGPAQVGLIDMLFRKALRVTSGVRSEMGSGAILNLASNDAAKLWNLPQYLHVLWSGPFQVLLAPAASALPASQAGRQAAKCNAWFQCPRRYYDFRLSVSLSVA
jgi:hypothetical protein